MRNKLRTQSRLMHIKHRAHGVIAGVTFASLLALSPAHARDNAHNTITQTNSCQSDYRSITTRPAKALLYTVIPCGDASPSHAAYVFGTFHSDAPDLAATYAQAEKLIPQLGAAMFEIVLTPSTQNAAAQKMFLSPNEPTLDALIGDALFAQLETAAEKLQVIPNNVLPQLKPWAAAVMLQYPPAEGDGIVVDQRLQNTTKAQGKKVMGLESPTEQLSIFDDLPMEAQISLLRHTLSDIDSIAPTLAQLKALYVAQDINGIATLAQAAMTDVPDAQLQAYLQDRLIDARNATMVKRALPLLQQNTALIAVGALHLPGKKGMLREFEKRGFQVYPVQ